MALNSRIAKAAVVVVSMGVVLVAAVIFVPRSAVDRVLRGPANDTLELINKAAEFAGLLKSSQPAKIYRLFNSTFQDEIPFRTFDSAFVAWQSGRRIARVVTSYADIQGLSGLISTRVYYDEQRPPAGDSTTCYPPPGDYEFLFQTWMRAPEGWQLMWVNKILDPVAMDYGRRDVSGLQEIIQLALDEIVTREGIEQKLGLVNPAQRVILVSRSLPPLDIRLPGKTVTWLSRDSIDFYRQRYAIAYYIEILPTRVLGNIASATFDVVAVTSASGALNRRTRSIKLFFRRVAGKWAFVNYGARW